jgi:restriction system protein
MAAAVLHFASGLIKVFWLLLPAAVVVRLIGSRRFKGLMGELRVSWAVRWHLDRRVYHTFCNLILPTADGTTQIDHVIVSQYGIFVIETKNMQGMISGSRQERSWTQQIGTYVRSFQNPLHQNYKHTKIVQELLGVSEAHVFSLIVFVDRSEFGSSMPENVTQGSGFVKLIQARKKRLFSSTQTAALISAINAAKLKNSFRNRKRHIQHVQSLVAAKQIRPQSCPLCGSPMVLREAKQGKNMGSSFWGCSTFPVCGGTINIA